MISSPSSPISESSSVESKCGTPFSARSTAERIIEIEGHREALAVAVQLIQSAQAQRDISRERLIDAYIAGAADRRELKRSLENAHRQLTGCAILVAAETFVLIVAAALAAH